MLVLDANILIRAVLGRPVRGLLTKYGNQIEFFAPDVAFDEAREHLPRVLELRRGPVAPAMEYLASLGELVQVIEFDTYAGFESVARQRLAGRDVIGQSWPLPSPCGARSGRRTPISSALESLRGRRIAWNCT